MDMRGLAHFIRDIRESTGNKKEEESRVEEELAKIRAKFIDTRHMTTYDRKKYVCKLMFISMLGYPISFGHMEGIKLMAGDTASEKLIGYLAASVLLNENSELMTLATHTVYRDLMSGSDLNRGLALTAIANAGNKDFDEIMCSGVESIIMNSTTDQHIRKRAFITLLKVYQKLPSVVDLATIVPKAIEALDTPQAGVCMAAITFMNGCISEQSSALFKECPSKLLDILSRIIIEKQTEPGYVYYGVPAPWLQVKVLRFLQYFPAPKDEDLQERATIVLRRIVKATDKVLKEAQTQQKQRGTQNRVSAMNAVLFEVVSLAIRWDIASKLVHDCVSVISGFISDKRESNIRYIGLTLLSRLSFINVEGFDFVAQCKQYQQQIIVGLHDPDVSIRRKALDVLVALCNPVNFTEIIKELTSYLPIAPDASFRSSLVIAIALLAEKYCDDSNTYIDVLLSVVSQAGEQCPPEIAYRAAQVIVNDVSVQKRAASTMFGILRSRKVIQQLTVRLAAFVLGEFGYQVALIPESSANAQLASLIGCLSFSTPYTQGVILSALVKFYNVYDDVAVRERVVEVLQSCTRHVDPELQQRASEYVALIENGNPQLLDDVLKPMPAFNEEVGLSVANAAKLNGSHDLWVTKVVGTEEKRLKRKKDTDPRDKKQKRVVVNLQDISASVATETRRSDDAAGMEVDALFEVSLPDGIEHREEIYMARRKWFTALLCQSEGMLFADGNVQLWCTQVYRFADCRLSLQVRPAVGVSLSDVSVDVLSADGGLLLQARHNADVSVAAGLEAEMEFAGRSLAPFRNPPTVRLVYTASGGQHGNEILTLPITAARFISPYDVQTDADVVQLFESTKKSAVPVSRTLSLQANVSTQSIMQLLTQQGLRTTVLPNGSLVAVGAYAQQPQGKVEYMPIGCELVRGGNSLIVTVYSANEILSIVAMDTISIVL